MSNADRYQDWANHYDRERPPHTYLEENTVLQLLSPKSKDRILDAACGTGRYAKLCTEFGAKAAGCDISADMLNIARLKLPTVEFSEADLNLKLPYGDAQFDKIVCSLSIRYVENLQSCFSEFRRLLINHGILIVTTIHPEMDWKTYERSTPSTVDVDATARIFDYRRDSFERVASETGFTLQSFNEISADRSIERLLTAKSFESQNGKKYVQAFSFRVADD